MNKTLSYLLTLSAGVILGGALVVCVSPKKHHHHRMMQPTRMERPLPSKFHGQTMHHAEEMHRNGKADFKNHKMMEHFMENKKCTEACLEKQTADEIRSCMNDCKTKARQDMEKMIKERKSMQFKHNEKK